MWKNLSTALAQPSQTTRRQPRGESSEVLARGLSVLFCFLDEDELGVTNISRRLGIAKSSVHRFLVTLEANGLVTFNPVSSCYSLGFRNIELGRALTRQLDVTAQSQQFMQELRDVTGESAAIVVRVGDRRMHLTQVESEHEIRQTFPVGCLLPLHAGAAGKTLLAFLPPDESDQILSGPLEPLANSRPIALSRLREELAAIRRDGCVITKGERMPGSRAVAAPVWSSRGDLMAITVAGPSYRFTSERAISVRNHVRDIAVRLTLQLGGEWLVNS